MTVPVKAFHNPLAGAVRVLCRSEWSVFSRHVVVPGTDPVWLLACPICGGFKPCTDATRLIKSFGGAVGSSALGHASDCSLGLAILELPAQLALMADAMRNGAPSVRAHLADQLDAAIIVGRGYAP